MRMTVLILLAAAALAAGLFLWRAGGALAPEATASREVDPEAPRITGIVFPDEISADGDYVEGSVQFASPGAPLARADFAVVEADFFGPFGFDPGLGDAREGAFPFYISSVLPQEVTLRVTLTDADGRESAPKTFSFVVADGLQGGF